jgi:hypothetical protein
VAFSSPTDSAALVVERRNFGSADVLGERRARR